MARPYPPRPSRMGACVVSGGLHKHKARIAAPARRHPSAGWRPDHRRTRSSVAAAPSSSAVTISSTAHRVPGKHGPTDRPRRRLTTRSYRGQRPSHPGVSTRRCQPRCVTPAMGGDGPMPPVTHTRTAADGHDESCLQTLVVDGRALRASRACRESGADGRSCLPPSQSPVYAPRSEPRTPGAGSGAMKNVHSRDRMKRHGRR